MQVLALSDRVLERIYSPDIRQRYPDVELLVGCGDLPYYFLEFMISIFNVPLIYVLGNHDFVPQHASDGQIRTGVQGGLNLHGKATLVEGLLCAGIQGSMRYKNQPSLMYTEQEMRWEVMRIVPRLLLAQWRHQRRLDLLVCHSPPFGIHDEQDIAHTGFRVFLPLLRYFKPRYMLHGHVHKSGRSVPFRTEYHNTTVINIFPYRLLEIEASAFKSVEEFE